ncbi:MAG: UDP-3-O-(3-hydroxymyristoyl)glucosamine N-acyltransferase [Phycisphaeraceae bacterium]
MAETPTPPTYTTGELAQQLAGVLRGPDDLRVTGLNTLLLAQPGEMAFIGDNKYAGQWRDSRASAALITDGVELEAGDGRALITVVSADLAMAKALALFAPPHYQPDLGIHPTAVIDPSASLGQNVRIGPHCVIGPRVRLGDEGTLHANVHIDADVVIGAQAEFFAGVVVRERCTIGERCTLHPNVSIGTDGFGFRLGEDERGPAIIKVPHIGTVTIGDDVEIGANSCIDRGKFGPTAIGNQVKIDNLVQIAHNCVIGNLVIIAGYTGVGGSVTIEDGATIAGGVVLRDHVTIGAGAIVAGAAVVGFDVPAGETWGGFPAKPMRDWMREIAGLKSLPGLIRQLKKK